MQIYKSFFIITPYEAAQKWKIQKRSKQ